MAEAPLIPGGTILAWMEFIEAQKGRAALDRVMAGLEPASKAAFAPSVSRARKYAPEPFDDFCRGVHACCGGYPTGLAMGAHSARQNERVLRFILRTADGDPAKFLSERLMSVHKLYADSGGWAFAPSGETEGTLTCFGFVHNEMSCWSNAGYVKACLDMMGVAGAGVSDVAHANNSETPCRMKVKWRKT
jgi:hypothetical protein